MEDPDFAKQDDRDLAARPLPDIPTKLLKQGFNVPPRQAAAYKTGEAQLKGALVLPLHSSWHCPSVPVATSGQRLAGYGNAPNKKLAKTDVIGMKIQCPVFCTLMLGSDNYDIERECSFFLKYLKLGDMLRS